MKNAFVRFLVGFLAAWAIMSALSLLFGEEDAGMMVLCSGVMALIAALVWTCRKREELQPVKTISCRRCGYYGAGDACCPRCRSTEIVKIFG